MEFEASGLILRNVSGLLQPKGKVVINALVSQPYMDMNM